MTSLVSDYEKFKAAGTEILAISVDSPEKNAELAAKLKIQFPVLSDPDHKTIEQYGILDPGGKVSVASVFVLDKKGIVRWSYITDDYKIRPLDETVLSEVSKIR